MRGREAELESEVRVFGVIVDVDAEGREEEVRVDEANDAAVTM